MKKKIQAVAFFMIFAFSTLQMAVPAYADPETSSEVATETESDSDDCSLSSLKIAQATLNPEFRSEQLTYTITVPHEVTRIALTAETSDPEAKKIINGTGDLEVGENLVTVVVTAEDGSVREYRITVTREEGPEGEETSEAESASESVSDETDETDETAEGNGETAESQMTTEEATEETAETSSESDKSPLETAPAGEREPENDKLAGRKILILVLCILCLVLLFIIIAALLLRRTPEDDDEEEDDEDGDEVTDSRYDELDEEVEESSDSDGETMTPEELARFYQSLKVDSEPESAEAEADHVEAEDVEADDLEVVDLEDDDLDDDFELLEEDDDFDFLDF